MTPEQSYVSDRYIALMPKLRLWALKLTRDSDGANDLVNDTYLKVIDNAGKFQRDTNFGAWAFRVMRNHFISKIRRIKETVCVDDVVIPRPPSQENNIRRKHLFRLIKLLPKEQRLPLLMAGIEGMDYEEIGVILGCEVGTVKSKISRARDLLDGAL